MARNTVQGQSYPFLNQIKDPAAQAAMRVLMDQVNLLRQPADTQNLGGNKITNAAEPTESTDLATKSYVDTAVAGVRATLLGSGATPLDVTALRGQLAQVQKAKLLLVEAPASRPVNGQPFELLYDTGPAQFFYWDPKTSDWVAL